MDPLYETTIKMINNKTGAYIAPVSRYRTDY